MDTHKLVDPRDNLEKGALDVQPLHSGPCPTCSAQPAWARPRRSFIRRSWIPLSTVALILFGLSYGLRAYHPPPHVPFWEGAVVDYPPPPDGNVDHCVGSTNWTTYYDHPTWEPNYSHGAESTFSLPLDSDAFYLISGGLYQHGLVSVEQSTQLSDTVDVRVRVAYLDNIALDHASVCQLARAEKEYGVGIFTSRRVPLQPHHGPAHGLKFDITFTLPAGGDGPLTVKKLETRLPAYDQNIADLGEAVAFDHLSLASVYGKLSVQSVTSEVGHFSVVDGEIDGHFTARSFLELQVASGRITPTVNLINSKCADPSALMIRAINGEIDAEIVLTSEVQTGGEFEVDALSRHGGIGLNFTDSPVDSILRCHAETTVGGIQVELDRAFEGTYSLGSVFGKKLVSGHDVEDPAGRGRCRKITEHESHGRIEGELVWVESDGSALEYGGHVELKGVLSSVELLA